MKISAVTKKRTPLTKLFVLWSMVSLFSILFWIPRASATGLTPDSFTTLAHKANPAVVNIKTVGAIKGGGRVFRHFFNGPNGKNDSRSEFFRRFYSGEPQTAYKENSLGSGFIIDQDGYIVTNNHVIENAEEIQVILKKGKKYNALVIGRDPKTDIALLKIDAKEKLPFIEFGNADILEVGQWVLAIGSPFGLGHTVTAGIVSAKGRVLGSGPYDDFIQTDASINPGNSGGPLLNMAGKAVGINTAIIRNGQGIGFAIPINLAGNIIEQLKRNGEVIRGWLGVVIQDLSEDIAEYYGVAGSKGALVTGVVKGGPADKAGIQEKDIIITVSDIKIKNSRELGKNIAGIDAGQKVEITVLRSGKEKRLTVQITKRDDMVVSEFGIDWVGIEIFEITKKNASKFTMLAQRGILVNKVQKGSKANEAGIWMGDNILEINQQPVVTKTDYYNAVNSIKKGQLLKMLINRKGQGVIVIEIKK